MPRGPRCSPRDPQAAAIARRGRAQDRAQICVFRFSKGLSSEEVLRLISPEGGHV